MPHAAAALPKASAFANNDVVLIAWTYPNKIDDCLGFAVFRKEGPPDGPSPWTALPTWVGFQGQQNKSWTPNTSDVWPIQKFQWKDLTAKPGGTYSYKIVPTSGQPSTNAALNLDEANAVLTELVTLTPDRGSFKTYFNRGILSTQYVAHQVPAGPSGVPNFKVLTDRIDQPGDPLRNSLAGQMIKGLKLLLDRAEQEGGRCFLALYELTDPELLQVLLKSRNLHIILSNTEPGDNENQPARQALHETAGIDVIDRFVPSGHIGHNKFCVYVDHGGQPQAALLGSTNWTANALCAQSNNALVVENPEIATAYRDYWDRLKADTEDNNAKQGATLRQENAVAALDDVSVDQGKVTLWFSPNTPHARSSHAGDDEATPPDLTEVFALMESAEQAILFLEFQPGMPSVVDKAAEIQNANPNLLIRGAVTDPKAAGTFNTTLVHRPGEANVEVVAASAISDQFAFWQQELLKSSPGAHAIIHDKIVVIDPMSPNCVIITGSHNQGYRASYNNDENLMIVKGHRDLAAAYAVHVLDIYDHYRFRYTMQKNESHAFSGLDPTDAWQDKYFKAGSAAAREVGIWFS